MRKLVKILMVQLGEDSQKKSVRGFRRADKGGWIGHSPMGGDWLSRPYRTSLGRRLVADRENKIQPRTIGPREFIPAFAAQSRGLEVQLAQQLERHRMNRALGLAAGAEAAKLAFAPAADRAFRHDAACRIPGAQK